MSKYMKSGVYLLVFSHFITKIPMTQCFGNSISTYISRTMLVDNFTTTNKWNHVILVEHPTSEPVPCHDSATYHNPLNELLTCEHHKNTPCEKWSNLGLSSIEIEELLTNCPVSCNVPCR